MHKISLLLYMLGAGMIALCASDFWHDKAYTQWTSDEVAKMLSASPWSQGAKASMQSGSNGMRRGGGMGRRGGIGGMGGGGMGRRGGYPGGGYPGGGGSEPMPQVTVTVRWQSALPVREALLRQAGFTKTGDSQVAARLTAPVTGYVIAVLGLPERLPSRAGRYGRSTDTDRDDDAVGDRNRSDDRLDQLKSATYLNRKDKASLFPEKIERDKDGSTLLFTFARTLPITLDDKEVEFVMRYGPMEIKRKFKLKDMVYQGRLEL